jgi:hypothetical protein
MDRVNFNGGFHVESSLLKPKAHTARAREEINPDWSHHACTPDVIAQHIDGWPR